MTLLKFSDVSLAFGAMPLLDKVSWQIARGERVWGRRAGGPPPAPPRELGAGGGGGAPGGGGGGG
ncbi:hypothetical protein ACI2KL_25130, partial [Pseudomonas yamanorum]|uniref:hypothetical protein n=1 Tax=Pseudomonas yamanorum TaxID=515393 RepID=UPI003850C033